MLNQIETRHLASLDQLAQSPAIEVIDERRGELSESFSDLLPLDEFDEQWAHVVLDKDMMEAPMRLEEVAVCWRTKEPLPEFFGEYRIPQPYEILAQENSVPVDGVEGRTQREFVRQLRYIDHSYRSGSGSTTYIRMSPNTSPLEIWHHELTMIGGYPYPRGYIRLDLTYHEYIETLLLTKGTHGWQYLFADVSFESSPIGNVEHQVKHMLETFPEIFPEHDYSDLQRRLEARL